MTKMCRATMLIILSGLPGSGKTTLAKQLARQLSALHLRIDSIEQTILHQQAEIGTLGYQIAQVIALDNLRLGHWVIADSVNPTTESRAAWRDCARQAGQPYQQIALSCLDPAEHQHRVTTRCADIPGHKLPDWPQVMAREYQAWQHDCWHIDTAQQSPMEIASQLIAQLPGRARQS